MELEDWGAIALVCPCQLENLENICEAKELVHYSLVMDNSNMRCVEYVCHHCNNRFDYEVKYKLFELLNKYYKQHNTYKGFLKYVSRKGKNIRLRYLKTIQSNSYNIIVIEAANLTQHPEYKM